MNIIESALLKSVSSDGKKTAEPIEATEPNKDRMVAAEQSTESVISKSIDKNDDSKSSISGRRTIREMLQQKTFSAQTLEKKGIVSISSADNELLNEYRNLRTKLLNKSNGRNFSTLVTSVCANHDISNISLNLAATFALDSGKTSVLINADNQTREIDEKLEINAELGMVDLLEDDSITMEDVLIETPITRLRYIPFGKAIESSAEFFSNERMSDSINVLVSRYNDRYPIINAPSIAVSADTRILMNLCDRVIIVIPYGESSEDAIKQAMLAVDQNKFAGAILDGF